MYSLVLVNLMGTADQAVPGTETMILTGGSGPVQMFSSLVKPQFLGSELRVHTIPDWFNFG